MGEAGTSQADWQQKGDNERRLGLLILENKEGPELADAARHLRSAAEAYLQAGWSDRRAECLLHLGKLQSRRQVPAEAAAAFVDALNTYVASKDQPHAIAAGSGAAGAYCAAGDLDEALRYGQQAVAIANDLNEHLRTADSLQVLGSVHLARHEWTEAIDALGRSLRIYQDYRKHLEQANLQELLGRGHFGSGDNEAARSHFEASLAKFQEMGRPHDVATTLSRWADSEIRSGNEDAGLELLDRCVELHRDNRNNDLLAQSLRLRGTTRHRAGYDTEAINDLREALELTRGMGDHTGAARALYTIGSIHAKAGRDGEAHSMLEQSLVEAEQQADHRITERILAAIVKVQRKLGNTDGAIATMEEWVRTLKDLGDRHEALRVIGTIARTHMDSGSIDEAEAHFRRLIAVCNPRTDESELLYAQHGLGSLLLRQNKHAEARPYLEHAVAGYTAHARNPESKLMPPVPLARLHAQLGNCLLELEEADEALVHFEYAKHQLEEQPKRDESDRNLLARVLVGLGNAHHQLADGGLAEDLFEEAATICEEQGDMRATMIIRKRPST